MKHNFSFITSSLFSGARVAMFALGALAMVACSDDPTASGGTDEPTTKEISEVVEWMDGRLQKEYYWMDEYNEKHSSFDLSLDWDKFLNATLKKLKTNTDDGGYYGYYDSYGKYKEERDFYTYVDREETSETSASVTRADYPKTKGYGISIYPYYMKVGNLEGYSDSDYCFIIDHIYPESQAAEAGLKRGDIILKFNGSKITNSNVQEVYSTLMQGKSTIELETYGLKEDLKEKDFSTVSVSVAEFEENPVAYSDILTLSEKYEVGDRKIGYLCYLSFDKEFDQKLIDAVAGLIEKGATDVILDLRANGGGHVTSSILLASMLLDESYVGPGKVYARLVHNPNNKVNPDEEYTLEKRHTPSGASTSVDIPNLNLKKVWIICSDLTASASEMVIVGLRGLDVEVELVGGITEGKNCGMEVTFKNHDGYKYTFAPITFMNENGKGFSDYGEGITPEHDLYEKSKDETLSEDLRRECAYFPMPKAAWGDADRDIALCETVLQICGKSLFGNAGKMSAHKQLTTRAAVEPTFERASMRLERPDLKSRGMILHKQDIQ